MICVQCNCNLVECQCPDVTARLRSLAESTYVYVGNIIEERILSGASKAEDFAGVEIHYPLGPRSR